MSILNRLMTVARKPGQGAGGAPGGWTHSQASGSSPGHRRRELLRVVLRDELQRHGIPPSWLSAEVLANTSRTGEQGLHWRLVVRHWDERLVLHAVALQNLLRERVAIIDPQAPEWLMGISWQFAPTDESRCASMPPAGSWAQDAPATAPRVRTASAPAAAPTAAAPAAALPSRDDTDARADLEMLLAIRDADLRQHAQPDAPGAQRPWVNTEPGQPG